MSNVNRTSFPIFLIACFLFSGCYTQLKVTDKTDEKEVNQESAYTYIPAYTTQSYIYNFTDPYYLRFLYPSYVYGYGYGDFYNVVSGINTSFAGNQDSDGGVRNRARSSGFYSPGERIDRRSGNNSRDETDKDSRSNRSGDYTEQSDGDQFTDFVRSRTSATAKRNNNVADNGNNQDRRSSTQRIESDRSNTSEGVSRVSVPRRYITSNSYEQRTTKASRAVIENRLRAVTYTRNWNNEMYNVPVANFDLWMNGNTGHSQYYGGGSSVYHSKNFNNRHGSGSAGATYSRSNKASSSGKVKSSGNRSRSSSSSVSRTRSSSSDNSGSRSSSKSRSSNNSDRGSNNDRNK